MPDIELHALLWAITFAGVCAWLGIVALVYGSVLLIESLILRIYKLAALTEAARALQAEGRSPWLNRWLRADRERVRRDGQDR